MMEEEEEIQRVNFNVSQALAYELMTLRVRANENIVKGDLLSLFNCLRAMRRTATGSIPNSKRKAFTILEGKIAFFLNEFIKSKRGFSHDNKVNLSCGRAYKLIEEYDELLMDVLQEIGFLMGRKSDASKIGGVKVEE